MVTIKDIAKMAGVSHGTASNVLNKKGNVSAEKIRLVEEAATQLGYQLNSQAQFLRKGNSDEVYIILPASLSKKDRLFFSVLHQHFHRKSIDVVVDYAYNKQGVELAIEKALAHSPKAVICCGVKPSRELLETKGSKVIYCVDFWNVQKSSKAVTVSFDHKLTYEGISKLISRYDIENLHILSRESDKNQAFIRGLEDYLDSEEPLSVTRVADNENLLNLFDLLKKVEQNTLLISTDLELTELFLKAVEWSGTSNPTHLVTICQQQLFHLPDLDYIEFNVEKCADQLARQILAESDEDLVIGVEGLYEATAVKEKRFHRLKLLTIDSPMTDAIRSLVDKYKEMTGVELLVDTLPYQLLYDMVVKQSSQLLEYDMVRLDMAWLRSLAPELLLTIEYLPELPKVIQKFDLDNLSEYMKIGGEIKTLPLDVSVQMLFYRRDLFEDALFKRYYFEKTRQHFEIPKSFADYDRLTTFFKEPSIQKLYGLHGHTISDSHPILTYSDIAPRLKEKVEQGELTEKIFRQVIEDYRRSSLDSLKHGGGHWRTVADNFALGVTAMEILYSNYAFRLLRSESKISAGMIGVADVPGSAPLLGGGCLGIVKKSDNQEAIEFIKWLYSDEILQVLSHLGGFILTNQIKNDISLNHAYPWLEHFEESLAKGSRFKLGKTEMTFEKEGLYGARVREILNEQR